MVLPTGPLAHKHIRSAPFGWKVRSHPDRRVLCDRYCTQREHFQEIRLERAQRIEAQREHFRKIRQQRVQRIEAQRGMGREICRRVAAKHGLTLEGFLHRSRKRPFAHARQEAAYLLALLTRLSLNQIGAVLGGYDHTTILHSIHAYARRQDAPVPRGLKLKVRKP